MALDVTKAREALEQPRGQQPAGCDLVSIERSTLRGLLALCERAGAALAPFAEFGRAFDAKPLSGIEDRVYGIHAGTEWEAYLRLSECRSAEAALAALRAAGIGTGGRDAEAQG